MQDHVDLECHCAICEAKAAGFTAEQVNAAQVEWERNATEKFGFYIHCLNDDKDSPTSFNVHTHGMESHGHLDFQIVIPLPLDTTCVIIHDLAKRAMNGEKFYSGQLVSKIIKGFDVKLVEATESNRKVLRVIFPDKHGKLDLNDISEKFAIQYIQTQLVSDLLSRP